MKKRNQIMTLIVGLLSVLFLANFTANVLDSKIAFYVITGVLILGGLINERKPGYAYEDASPDLRAITKWVGKVGNSLHRRLLTGMEISQDITLVPNIKDSIILPGLKVENGPGPFTGDFAADSNDLTYSDRTLKVEAFQRDIKVKPSKYRTTYLSEKRKRGEGADNLTIPFAEYTLDEIIKQNSSILNNKTAFYGIGRAGFTDYNPATDYLGNGTEYITFSNGIKLGYFKVIAPTTAGETPTTHPLKFEDVRALAIVVGLGTKINAGRTSGEITNVTSTGSLATDALAKFTEVWRKWPEVERSRGGIIYCAVNSRDRLNDDMVAKVNKYTESDTSVLYLPGTDRKCIVKPVSWMSGSEQLICTRKDNLLMGTDLLSDFEKLKTIEHMYHVDLSITGVLGFNYQDGDLISMNDM